MDEQRTICLFDVDGTLTKSRLSIEDDMYQMLKKLKEKHTVGLVGGSDSNKISGKFTSGWILLNKNMYTNKSLSCLKLEQMNRFQVKDAKNYLIEEYEYVFTENGLIAYENGQSISNESILKRLGEDAVQEVINFSLEYLSKLKLPKKRGNFIEFRTGMINICPIGRSCTLEERLEFFEYDKQHKIREQLVSALTEQFGEKYQMKFSIGGQISIDAFPIGWDKTYCLKFLKDKFDKIYFFGDRTDVGGNDHEIYAHELVEGYKVENPSHTIKLLKSLFNLE